jgi:hypothetical protein
MARSPYFPFYPGDWLRNDVSGCSLEAQGLWLRMMIVMHDAQVYGQLILNNEPMPMSFLAKKCGISPRKLGVLLAELDQAGVINRKENGVIYSGRMERDERERQQNRARQKEHYDKTHGKPNGDITETSRLSNAKPNAKPNGASSSSYSISDKKEVREESAANAAPPPEPKPKRGTRLPETFMLTSEMRTWAQTKRPGVDVEEETTKFCNHFRSVAGRTGTKLDWNLTWQNWILNARGTNGNGIPPKNVHIGKPDEDWTEEELERIRSENPDRFAAMAYEH